MSRARRVAWLAVALAASLLTGSVASAGTPATAGNGKFPWTGDSPPSCSGPVTLEVSPDSGAVPLTVQFDAVATGATSSTEYSWNFGDGSTLAGIGTLFSAPLHEYLSPGEYTVVANITGPGGPGRCMAVVSPGPAPLAVVIDPAVVQGYPPLNVSLLAVPAGGSGVYTSPIWNATGLPTGRGLEYNVTLRIVGTFHVSVSITDSTGGRAEAYATIDVTAPSTSTAVVLPPAGWIAAAGGVVGGILVGVLLGGRARGRSAGSPHSDGASPPAEFSPPIAPGREEPSNSPSAPPKHIQGLTARAPADHGDGRPVPDSVGITEPRQGRVRVPPRLLTDSTLRTSERILEQLRTFRGSDAAGRAPRQLTQAGIQDSTGLPQGAVASALGRMVRAGLVEWRLDHVPGQNRRVKVYRLTSLGEQVARRDSVRPSRP